MQLKGTTKVRVEVLRVDRAFADRLPEPPEKEFSAFVESVRSNGVIVPLLVTTDGLLLDGHRRLRAAREVGLAEVPIRVVDVDGAEGWQKAVALLSNLHRRHLSAAQRADLGSSLLRVERKEAKERKHAGQKSGGRGKRKLPDVHHPEVSPKRGDCATDRVAAAVGVNRQTVERVEAVKKADPALASRMLEGKISVAGAYRKVQVEQIKERAAAETPAETGRLASLKDGAGRYRCVLLDPPWAYTDSGTRGAAAGVYPTMNVEEISKLKVPALLHPQGAHLWMWCTCPMNRDRAPHTILEAWGLEWVSEFFWKKTGKMGQGHYLRGDVEFCILAMRKGAQRLPLLRADIRNFIEADRGAHSEKPEEARRLIEIASPSPRLELFARASVAGWDRWGLEA